MTPIKQRWAAGDTTLGAWLAIPNPVVAEATARAGFDYVCLDAQHGAIEYSDAVPMIQAVLLGGSSPIVRVPWNEPGIIGKMLDAGAHGVIIPMVNTVAEAEAATRACRYAIHGGSRSYGPTTTAMRIDGPYVPWAAENVACIPMIETTTALENLDDILAVPGIDGVYVGPADLSLTLGLPPGNNDDDASFADALASIVTACQAARVVPGIHASGALTPKRLGQGFGMVTVTTDILAMRLGYTAELATARGDDADAGGGSIY